MLSKFAIPDTDSTKISTSALLKESNKSTIHLAKYKLPELKVIARDFKLHVTGTKPVLINRIEEYFKRTANTIKIQKCIRGFFVRKSFKIRGDALKNRSLCVNDTDFYTMDPLVEIPHDQFYSYTDAKNFVYGFNLNSLIMLYKKKGSISNPYNREKMDLVNILRLHSLVSIIYKDYVHDNEKVNAPTPVLQNRNTVIDASQNTIITSNPVQTNEETPIPLSTVNSVINYYGIRQYADIINNNIAKLTLIRTRSLDVRVREVFMDIDQLGHYTDCNWFLNLDRRSLYIFYVELGNIWRYRAQMSNATKYRICPYDPFLNVLPSITITTPMLSADLLRMASLRVIENLVYMGIDSDYRNLGAFHVLTGLTLVSVAARTSMPWLYDSIL